MVSPAFCFVRAIADVLPSRLEVLRALVGHIPPNPLWAELVWQRQHEMAAHAQPSGRA